MNIITIKDGKVVPDINVLTIPELKVLYNKFEGEDRNLLFTYLHHTYEPSSPYSEIPDFSEREEKVRKDFRGNFKPNHDKDILKAKEKMELLTHSPAKDLLDGLRINIKNISNFLKTTEVNAGKDGNLTQMISAQKSVKEMIRNLKAVEQEFLLESQKNRGNSKQAIDEGEDYN